MTPYHRLLLDRKQAKVNVCIPGAELTCYEPFSARPTRPHTLPPALAGIPQSVCARVVPVRSLQGTAVEGFGIRQGG